MRRTRDERVADWMTTSEQVDGFQRRHWRVVQALAVLTVLLLVVGLVADVAFGADTLATASWIGAAASGVAMLVWFRNTRLFVG